ncbi:hypothetical protein ACFV6G_00525 [Streptomyces lavendulae]|uniref:hypothetical protein n=1 Tax=Streptomyces lavendulae TaxID=1914 RepID=UPI003674C11C
MTEQTNELPALDPVLKTGASKRNIASAEKAYARVAELAWTVHRPYPGSDTHWEDMECELPCQEDGSHWRGSMFYSHMRRGRRHRGCLPKELQVAAVEALAKARKGMKNAR